MLVAVSMHKRLHSKQWFHPKIKVCYHTLRLTVLDLFTISVLLLPVAKWLSHMARFIVIMFFLISYLNYFRSLFSVVVVVVESFFKFWYTWSCSSLWPFSHTVLHPSHLWYALVARRTVNFLSTPSTLQAVSLYFVLISHLCIHACTTKIWYH